MVMMSGDLLDRARTTCWDGF